MSLDILVVVVIALCLVFTYTNGFQDGSSVCAAGVASRAFTVRQAIALVCLFEFLGALCGGAAVATTIHSICDWHDSPRLLPVLAAALAAAIVWNVVTRRFGLPSSSTHALVGGLLGAVSASGHENYIIWGELGNFIRPTGVTKVIVTLILSPVAGFLAGSVLFQIMTLMLMRASTRVNTQLNALQWVTTALLAFGHGSNDPPKSMAIMMLALTCAGWEKPGPVPYYIHILGALAIVAGVMSIAPSIVKRVGTGIYRLRTFHALVSELAAGIVVTTGSVTGGPVSATQVISSAVMGVGSAASKKGVHWLVAKDILTAWFLTIPAAALLAGLMYGLLFRWVAASMSGW